MNTLLHYLAITTLVLLFHINAAELGDPAAELKIAKWLKGDPVQISDSDKTIYVVEFWATWCPPCRTSIPHLTELQKRFKDKKVVIIGITDEKENVVKPFLQKMGDAMDYHVALDDRRRTSAGYMEAFEIGGIPHAFIVRGGKILWEGHPMDGLDRALEEITANKYDLAVAKQRRQAQKLQEKFYEAAFEGDEEEARKIGEELKNLVKTVKGVFPNDEFDPGKELEKIRNQLALQEMVTSYFENITEGGEEDQRQKLGEQLAEKLKGNPMRGNELSWFVLTSPEVKHRDLKLALQIAKQACADTDWKEPHILDTYARALFMNGEKKSAIEYQQKALAAASAEMKEDLQRTLTSYKEDKLPPVE